MHWLIDGCEFGGVAITRFGDEYHLFTTRSEKGCYPGPRWVHHAVSTDLRHWRDLPDALLPAPENEFEAFTLYDLHAIEHDGRYYLYYTGLDRFGDGQKQAIGVAVSDDAIHWQRYAADPIVTADPAYYEPEMTPEAVVAEKDRNRQWFRDPWVVYDPANAQWVMAIGARTADDAPMHRGCFACATSTDLLHWTPRPAMYAPRRFHTAEVPAVFEREGRWYLFVLTHHLWGEPFTTTDPWVTAGGFWAYSDDGVMGPWRVPADEVLCGGQLPYKGGNAMRAGVFRCFDDGAGEMYVSYHLWTRPDDRDEVRLPADEPFATTQQVMPTIKPLRFTADRDLYVAWPAIYTETATAVPIPGAPLVGNWTRDGDRWTGREMLDRSLQPLAQVGRDLTISLRLQASGMRAGVVLRQDAEDSGVYVLLDRNLGCLEIGSLDGSWWDRRSCPRLLSDCQLRVAAYGPSIEVYIGDRLMIHQVRYRETGGDVSLLVEHGCAVFSQIELATLPNELLISRAPST